RRRRRRRVGAAAAARGGGVRRGPGPGRVGPPPGRRVGRAGARPGQGVRARAVTAPAGAITAPRARGRRAPGYEGVTRARRVAPGDSEAWNPVAIEPRLPWLHRSRTVAGRLKPSWDQLTLTVAVAVVLRLNSATTNEPSACFERHTCWVPPVASGEAGTPA